MKQNDLFNRFDWNSKTFKPIGEKKVEYIGDAEYACMVAFIYRLNEIEYNKLKTLGVEPDLANL